MRLALRSLLKSPGFTLVVVATLALCIGANSAIFSVVNAVLLKPYPWPGAERLVYVHNNFPKLGGSAGAISIPDYLDHRASVSAFAESALITGFSANLSLDGQPERVYGLSVTPSTFALLQTPPALGRAFTAAEAEPGAARTVVLNHAFWRNRFAGDPAIIGRTLRLNGETYTVLGVMPEGFYFPSLRAQFYVPLVIAPQQRSEAARNYQNTTMLARLRPDASVAQAQAEVDSVHRATRERLPEWREEYDATGYGSIVLDFLEQNVRDIRSMLWLLQAGVVAALLIGCANVANLLLARATARHREFAIRSALGAGRVRLIRQSLAESLLLFPAGGLLGLLLAEWGLAAVTSLGLASLPRGFSVALDGRVVVFTLGCSLLTGLVFGALPAFAATRGNAADALRAGGRATASRRQLWLRGALAIGQVALSLMLLATAGLLLRSFHRLQEESPGFSAERTLTASLTLPAARYDTAEKRAAFVSDLTKQLAAIPGVSSVGAVNSLPFGLGNPQGGYQIEGFDPGPGKPNPNGMIRQVSPGYFDAMGIPLLRGRLLEPTDALGRENVVVIDRFLADRYWPGGDALGKHISRGEATTQAQGTWTIVGVVGTIKHWDLAQDVTKETLYFPYAQTPNPTFSVVLKTKLAPGAVIAAVREAVLAIDPDQPVYDIKTMEERITESLTGRRVPMQLLSGFAVLALILSALGIYGVLAFAVHQRTGEFGVRMALGADRGSILGLVLRQGAVLTGIGLAVGFAGYFALASFLASQLFGTSIGDAPTLLLAPAVLALVALTACLIPARRAAKVDPITALRAE